MSTTAVRSADRGAAGVDAAVWRPDDWPAGSRHLRMTGGLVRRAEMPKRLARLLSTRSERLD
jgi:hypothetical protein